MPHPLVSLVALSTALALPAQTSVDYRVHHDFLPPSGTVYTNAGSTGTANDGTPTGNVTLAVGPLATAVTLGGVLGDQINCGPTPLLGAQARTVSVWARTTATTGIVTPFAFGTNPGNGTKWDMDIDCANGGVFELGISGGRTVGQGPAVNDGQWHMLTTVLPAGATTLGQVRLVVEGVLAYTNSGTQTINTTNGPVIIGRSANPLTLIQFFPGDVDDAVLWSVPLTDAQVEGLHDVAMNAGLVYSAGEYERLLEVYRQNQPEVTIAGRTWRRATGLTGSTGLTVLAGGGYQLVFDTATGAGVITPAATFATSGTGCASPLGVPALSCPQLPVIGATLVVTMSNVSATSLPFMVLGATSIAPFPISFLGLATDPACLISVSLDLLAGPLAVVGTSATLSLPLPGNPALVGVPIYVQGAQLELTTGFWNLSDQGIATLGF